MSAVHLAFFIIEAAVLLFLAAGFLALRISSWVGRDQK